MNKIKVIKSWWLWCYIFESIEKIISLMWTSRYVLIIHIFLIISSHLIFFYMIFFLISSRFSLFQKASLSLSLSLIFFNHIKFSSYKSISMTRFKSERIAAIMTAQRAIASKTFRKQFNFSQFNSKQRKKRRYRSESKWYLHIIDCSANILSITMRTYYRLQC